MKIIKITLIVIAAIAILVVSGLAYIGLFTNVTVTERETGGFVIAGKDITGPYMNVGPTMNNVDSTLRSIGIECTCGFGVYYDNPNEVPQEKCRSFVGNVIENADSSTLAKVVAAGLRIDSVPKKRSMVIDYAIKSNFSYMIGPMKAYPALTKYIAEKKYAPTLCFELYDVPGKMINYVMQY